MKELPETFDEWVENFGEWQKIVGFDPACAGDFELSIKFDWECAPTSESAINSSTRVWDTEDHVSPRMCWHVLCYGVRKKY